MTWEELKEEAKKMGYEVTGTTLGGEYLHKGSFEFTEYGRFNIRLDDAYSIYIVAIKRNCDQMLAIMKALQ